MVSVYTLGTTYFFSPSHIMIGPLHVVMGRRFSSCDTHFDSVPYLPAFCIDVVQPSFLGSHPSSISLHLNIQHLLVVSPPWRSLASLQMMSSFLMWSFLVLPPAHLSILISVVCCFCVSVFMSAQPSDPHINAGFTTWFCRFLSCVTHSI